MGNMIFGSRKAGGTGKSETDKSRLGPAGDLRGTFFFGGTIRVGGPKIRERLKAGDMISIDDHGGALEFLLSVENRPKDQLLEVSPVVDLSLAEVEISIDDPDVSTPEAGLIIVFRAGGGRRFEIVINPKQARVIGQYCKAYANASGSIAALSRKHRVMASDDAAEIVENADDSPTVRPES